MLLDALMMVPSDNVAVLETVEDARCASCTRSCDSGLWQAINLSLCRHAVAIVAFKEVAEWDTPLTCNQKRQLGVFCSTANNLKRLSRMF